MKNLNDGIFKTYLRNNLLQIVAVFRSAGYACQFFSGLYLAGAISFIFVLPLAILGKYRQHRTSFYLDNIHKNAINIHSIAGIISSLPIIYVGAAAYGVNGSLGNLELSLFGCCLFISFVIFRVTEPTSQVLFKYKHRIGSFILLLGNTLQYHAGIQLGKHGLSMASILFLIAMLLLFFVKTQNFENNP